MRNLHPHFISPQVTLPQEGQMVLLQTEPYLYQAGFIFTGGQFHRHVFETGEEIPMERIIAWAPQYLTGPLVFLDIDGVLTRKPDYGKIDPGLLSEFLSWVDTVSAVVILVSSWREERLEQTLRHLPERLAERIADQLPVRFESRAEGILNWLSQFGQGHTQGVILDDEGDQYLGTPLAPMVVSPDTETGMKAPGDYLKAFDIIMNQTLPTPCNP